jgi:hypothetical protein
MPLAVAIGARPATTSAWLSNPAALLVRMGVGR